MNNDEPIELLFEGMQKLGPGDNDNTLRALKLLPKSRFNLIVDAGCGSGRQTLVLAKTLGTVIHALDSYEPFLKDLTQHAKEAQIDHLVQTHCMDMQEIPKAFKDIDLLWAEGSAYNIGFNNALVSWAPSITPGGFMVVSELSWLKEHIPDQVKTFFQSAYPQMQSIEHNITMCKDAGYTLLDSFTLPRESWTKDYYDILKPRAQDLKDHENESVRDFARETLEEIEIFEISQDSYGYVVFILQKA